MYNQSKEEIWNSVIGYEGYYLASNMGRIMNAKTGRILRPGKNHKGYLQVNLSKNGKSTMNFVHRLVAKTFIKNPENKPCIDHIDGNPMNNCIWNLRWCTYKENNNNPITKKRYSEAQTGKHLSEETKNKMSQSKKGKHFSVGYRKKLSESQRNRHSGRPVICFIDNIIIKIYTCLRDTDKDGFKNQGVCACCKGKLKSYKGYNWRYADENEIKINIKSI